MREKKVVSLKNLIPRKEKRLINIEKPLQSKEPIFVKKIGRRWWKIIDGHHRYFKSVDLGIKKIEVII